MDASGVYVAGLTLGPLGGSAPAGSFDAMLVKFDLQGNRVFAIKDGGSVGESAHGLCAVDGSVYVAGWSSSTTWGTATRTGPGAAGFVLKYTTDGQRQWLSWTNGHDRFSDIACNQANGNTAAVGWTQQQSFPGETNQGGNDAFVQVRNPAGELQWTRLLGTSSSLDEANGVTFGDNGAVYMVGTVSGSVAGQTGLGSQDAFVAKYSATGTREWVRLIGTASIDVGYRVAYHAGNNSVYVVGITESTLPNSGGANINANTPDAFIAKYSTGGTLQWVRQWGSSPQDFATDVDTDARGIVYVTGYSEGTLDGQPIFGNMDVFVTAFNASGSQLGIRTFGTITDDYGRGIAVGSALGNATDILFVAGRTSAGLDNQTHAGNADQFVKAMTNPFN